MIALSTLPIAVDGMKVGNTRVPYTLIVDATIFQAGQLNNFISTPL